MNSETHNQLASFIWSICNLLRGPYKRNEYRKVILPLTVLRRFDCLLAPTKQQVLAAYGDNKGKSEKIINSVVFKATGYPFYNHSKLDFAKLLDDPNHLAQNLGSYIKAYSSDVRAIMEKFKFEEQIAHMASKNILYEVIKKFAALDLSSDHVDNIQMAMCSRS
ncbi:MAG: type I restriction-modification system subunit M N-terminal domain-containing protein [Nitrosomonadales bacterium]